MNLYLQNLCCISFHKQVGTKSNGIYSALGQELYIQPRVEYTTHGNY